MIHFDLPKQKSSIIKVIGIGGGGSNAVNYMHSQIIEGVDFIVCNTDAKALEQSNVQNKIQLGPASTQGLGAGANPEMGKIATEESLQEIKSILEVNTRMAFITAGMGGGTGTGGAPIVAQVCKELGILTVGIVTTPFGFEGPRRLQQAEEGIKALKPHVDTLLVISNDKLRMQYGNLKMREAFGKADNVLATAAKCITDIINSKGHIIVDFADVCTVMKNGGVAVLGSAAKDGENRALETIQEALNSPLLNDSDIKGAKWVLININSAEGEYECTMDELEIVSDYLRSQAGQNTDVIVGMGNDNSLDKKLGITLIATGFSYKDPFGKPAKQEVIEAKPEKVVFNLEEETQEEKKVPEQTPATQQILNFAEVTTLEPELKQPLVNYGYTVQHDIVKPTDFDLEREAMLDAKETEIFELELSFDNEVVVDTPPSIEEVADTEPIAVSVVQKVETVVESIEEMKLVEKPTLLSKPSQIYAEQIQRIEEAKEETIFNEAAIELSIHTVEPTPINEEVEEIVLQPQAEQPQTEIEVEDFGFEIFNKPSVVETLQIVNQEQEEIVEADEFLFEITTKPTMVQPVAAPVENVLNDLSEEEERRRKAQERIQKLRNLSFNTQEVTNEFDNVPAYVRRNMELFGSNTLASVENFYSSITVEKQENNQANISTINTYLDGKKPD
jgi:cell division protein FtsZ